MAKKEKVFALHPVQKDLIEKRCFDECGKICVGGLNDKELGCMFVCCEENCPHQKDLAKKPIGTVDGKEVWIRGLK